MGSLHMKIFIIGLFACALFGGTVIAQTFDGHTPAEEHDCDSLNGAAFGLCVAYCEAQDCDVNLTQPSCPQLRKNFSKKTGSTVFPCDARCGDGIVNQPSEVCDDGNAVDCDGCSSDCSVQNIGDPGCTDGPEECVPQACGSFTNCNLGSSCAFQGVCGSL